MRTKARETVFKIVFASLFTGETDERLKGSLYKGEKLTAQDTEYADRVLKIIDGHRDEFAEILDSRSLSFPEERLFYADKSILYIALAEIKYMDDIPPAVSANEAANLASAYSTEKSASFVSGILAEIIKG